MVIDWGSHGVIFKYTHWSLLVVESLYLRERCQEHVSVKAKTRVFVIVASWLSLTTRR